MSWLSILLLLLMPNTVVSSAHKDRVIRKRRKQIKTDIGETHQGRRRLSRDYEIEAT